MLAPGAIVEQTLVLVRATSVARRPGPFLSVVAIVTETKVSSIPSSYRRAAPSLISSAEVARLIDEAARSFQKDECSQ